MYFSRKAPMPGFSIFRQGTGDLNVYVSTLQYEGPSFGVVNLAGESVTRVRFSGKDEGLRLAIHEVFHLFQSGNFKHEAVTARPWKIRAETLASAKIERELLYGALYAADWKSYAERFVALRKDRYAAEDKPVKDYEAFKELIEGTARYVELGGAAGGKYTTKALPLEDLFNIRMPYFMYSFYGSGLAQCRILDKLGVNWKTQAQAGRPLFEILSAAIGVGQSDLRNEPDRIRTSYGFRELTDEARKEISLYASNLSLLAKNHKNSAWRMIIRKVTKPFYVSGEFGEHILAGGETFSPWVQRLEVEAPRSGMIRLYKGSLITRVSGNGASAPRDLDFAFKEAAAPALIVDGKTMSAGCARFHKSVSMRHQNIDLILSGTGEICIRGNIYELSADPETNEKN